MNKLHCPEFAEVQDRQRTLSKAQQERGIPLIQRRDDGVHVSRHADGRENELPYRDLEHNLSFE